MKIIEELNERTCLKKYDILPVGSVITSKVIKLEIRKKHLLIITGRFYVQDKKKKKYFDYECNYYPGGTQDGTKIYMNHEYVDDVIFTGYSDNKEIEYVRTILNVLKENGFKKSKYNDGLMKSLDKEKL